MIYASCQRAASEKMCEPNDGCGIRVKGIMSEANRQRLPSINGRVSHNLYKMQKILQIQKGLLSRSATGWMLHFNVRNTNCLLNSMCQRTCCGEGVTHTEMKHPACCTAAQKSFFESARFLSYNLHFFFVPFICLARPCSRFAYGVI